MLVATAVLVQHTCAHQSASSSFFLARTHVPLLRACPPLDPETLVGAPWAAVRRACGRQSRVAGPRTTTCGGKESRLTTRPPPINRSIDPRLSCDCYAGPGVTPPDPCSTALHERTLVLCALSLSSTQRLANGGLAGFQISPCSAGAGARGLLSS